MLICLVGPPQAGKDSLARFLVNEHAFERIRLGRPRPRRDPIERDDAGSTFSSSSEFLDHATRTWRRNFVTTDLVSKAKLVEFAKRPASQEGHSPPSLEDFVERDDLLYHGALPLAATLGDRATDAETLLSQLDLKAQTLGPTTPSKQRLSPSSEAPPSPSPSPARQITPIPSPELSRTGPAPTLPDDRDRIPTADSTLSAVLPLAHLTLPNPYPTLGPFLSSFSLATLAELLRPSWDTYFMLLASLASLRSNCMKRRVGAVLVRDKRVVSTGYNGTPRGVRNCGEGGCGRCNSHGDGWGEEGPPDAPRPVGLAGANEMAAPAPAMQRNMSRVGEALDECLCLHAEENALLEAGRERVSGGGTEGAVLYCNTCPCLRCTVKIVQCGVKEVIYSLSYSMDASSRRVMEEAGIVLRQIPQPAFPR
ncbi:putative dCMP deaminase [Rhodotorula taiwanensis]|uniref:dCMP deaminase n=1 Tax=Rhodotorula taiwanensis TaxID=741276 RepID=A0A2S5B6L2_9BASI|nr:putative dCMP deaminase [Rhodotorula taiwanensis]